MIDWGDSRTFWLTVTNVGLGALTVAFCVIAGRALFQDLTARLRRPGPGGAVVHRDADVGLTMARGAERMEPMA